MVTDRDRSLREHVVLLLEGRGAHESLDRILADVPAAVRGQRPSSHPHSPWEILEHLRIAQRDILDYVRDPGYVSPQWPQGYWPPTPQPPSAEAWANSLEALDADMRELVQWVGDAEIDLLAPITHGRDGHTVLREALLIADHNAYHGAEMVAVRRALGAW